MIVHFIATIWHKMDRFENMNAFIRVVEAGGISVAADRLGVAKSAISRRLKELEAHLGVELFHPHNPAHEPDR